MEEWIASLITVGIFCCFLLILVLSFQAFNLCEAKNRWGIVLFSLVLPVIGIIVSLVYFEKKYHFFSKPKRKHKSKDKKKKNKK